MTFTFLSPAKVNFFFKVLSKREDGYHDIASLYQAISLYDVITLKKAKKDFFSAKNCFLKFDETNLIKKALDLFRLKTKIKDPVEIFLEKNIPIQGGLGGGSSNAATTLFALNELFLKPLNISSLIDIAKKISADTPFFFSSGRAFCSGVGDVFEDMAFFKKKLNFYIACPNFGMCTKKVYENLKKIQLLQEHELFKLKRAVFQDKIKYFNDLEVSAFELNPKLKLIKQKLLKMGFKKVLMTGSGSCFICIGNQKIEEKPYKIKEITFFPVFNIQRKKNSWYSV